MFLFFFISIVSHIIIGKVLYIVLGFCISSVDAFVIKITLTCIVGGKTVLFSGNLTVSSKMLI